MWREEPGCFEMLLAFYKENELDSFKSYRDFLLDLLECYERKNVKSAANDQSVSKKRRRLSEEEMCEVYEDISQPAITSRETMSKAQVSKDRPNVTSDDNNVPLDLECTQPPPPPNGTNLASSSASKVPDAAPSSRREKVTASSSRPLDPSKMYVRVPDPKPLPTLGQQQQPKASVKMVRPLLSTPLLGKGRGGRTIAPSPASVLGSLSRLSDMFGAGQNFGSGFPCILCSKSFDSEETYQQHDCFASCSSSTAAFGPPGMAGLGQKAEQHAFKCRCCALSFPSDHRRLRHERNAHGLNNN